MHGTMEYNSESSLESTCKNLEDEEAEKEPTNQHQPQGDCQTSRSTSSGSSWRLISSPSTNFNNVTASGQARATFGAITNKSLSSQVMEYYQKYSQNSNLNQYFSLPTSSNNAAETAKYYYSIYELTPKYVSDKQNCEVQDYNLKPYVPRERRRWIRPPLIGQSSSTDGSSNYIQHSLRDSKSHHSESQEQKLDCQSQSKQNTGTNTEGIIITEEKSTETSLQDTSCNEANITDRKASSPTSSVASHKPLEWDSGADVGYLYAAASSASSCHQLEGKFHQLSTLERMALARGCSAALRLDPEGTTEQQQSPGSIRTTVTATVLSLTTSSSSGGGNGITKTFMGSKPDANSTPLPGNVSGSESEIEITPIVKSHLPGIIAGNHIKSNELGQKKSKKEMLKKSKDGNETPKSSNLCKIPLALKYSTIEAKCRQKGLPPQSSESHSDTSAGVLPLKKSSSMHLLVSPNARLPLKRSQSDLNLCGNDKPASRLIFNSTSSIATVVNSRPTTCNKLIQTSMRICSQESIGIQVSVNKDEEKPPLPKRATSLAPRSLNSILKNSKSTYRVQSSKSTNTNDRSNARQEEQNQKEEESSSDFSQNACLTPQADDIENVTGRANSFEYFPGRIYENVPNGSTSQVSSVDTGRSTSTMPNTSSSIEEKLWGDSDSLVRDLERSVNILKTLVDANELDKHVKKRLIHHVVKRLVTAKYADDKIERDLTENVPWNPADARNKVYRREIIQALAKNTTDSSDDWKPVQKKSSKKQVTDSEARAVKKIIHAPAEIESSNSDKFERNTDRTVMDGRKARMGLRTDDCDRRSSSHTPTNKSDSSDCFLPQRGYNKKEKIKNVFVSPTSNSSPQGENRALSRQPVANSSRQSSVDSSNELGDSTDWRLPTTASERKYEMRRCSNSDSGDTKLVSYAEMEKQNQIIWIKNEISHLSNLKKLLEQPKSKSEKPTKSLPLKINSAASQPTKCFPSNEMHKNGEITCYDEQLNRHWSSHCNLAYCSPSARTNSVRRLKKRNSCTQTETGDVAAYSHTGSAIVSAKIESPNMKLANAYVQTARPVSSSTSVSSISQHIECPVHGNDLVLVTCTCSNRICECCKSRKSSEEYRLYINENKEDSEKDINSICKDSEDLKETKNQLNTTKLKCTCEHISKETGKSRADVLKKSTAISQTCENYCNGSIRSCRRCKFSKLPNCQCSKDCQCENKLQCDFEKMHINKPTSKTLFDNSTDRSFLCKCQKIENAHSSRSECNHLANKKTQPYFLADSNQQRKFQNCSCGSKPKSRGNNYSSTNTNNSTFNDHKQCRICGIAYQKDRMCNCNPKSYPKAVAYELSFADEKTKDHNKVGVEVKCIDKRVSSEESIKYNVNTGGCSCDDSQQVVKTRCNCKCRMKCRRKLLENKKCTLQDYLISNNPGFADNVEIRRQYISEIQRLRQCRKDSRVHLLAMAATSKFFTSPRPTKVTKCIQRKISDEDMKKRRRKRYLQLTEVRAKRKQQQLQEEARCNKLMAKIYCKKLQQKVLKGQVDLSQSMSVISNL